MRGDRPSAKKVMLIGIACGLAAVVLVRLTVGLLLGGLRALAILGVIGLVWFLLRGPRPRRDS